MCITHPTTYSIFKFEAPIFNRCIIFPSNSVFIYSFFFETNETQIYDLDKYLITHSGARRRTVYFSSAGFDG